MTAGPVIDAGEVARNLDRVRDRIAVAGGNPDEVTVLAVTKGFGSDVVAAALGASLTELGENYAQELQAKAAACADASTPVSPRWHFIGRLQSNKVRLVSETVGVWQSLDRASVIDEVARRCPGATAFVQVNAADETGKGGCALADAPDLVARGRDAGLDIAGLMTVGVAGDLTATDAAFTAVSALADRLGLEQRSMGMTDDLEAAVRAGTTMIRVGSALFGPRPSGGER